MDVNVPIVDPRPPKQEFQKDFEALKLILDVYKHHSDLYLKGYAFYLLSCSIFVGYGLSQSADIYNRLSAGFAVAIASVVALIATRISLNWLADLSSKAKLLAERQEIEIISFWGLERIAKTLQVTTIILMLSGVLFVTYSTFLANSLPPSRSASPATVTPQP